MARQFTVTAGDDYIEHTAITAINTGDWTIGGWFKLVTVVNGGRILDILTGGGSGVQQLFMLTGPSRWVASQNYATAAATSVSNEVPVTGAWGLVFATHRASDAKTRIFIGDLTTAVAELTYASQPAGSGTRTTAGVHAMAGDSAALNRPLDGAEARLVVATREWSLADMERHRKGLPPDPDGTVHLYWAMDSPLVTECLDASGHGWHGTVVGTSVVAGPPLSAPNRRPTISQYGGHF